MIVDEVHERDLQTDFLLTLLKDVQSERMRMREAEDPPTSAKPLKIILMSATVQVSS